MLHSFADFLEHKRKGLNLGELCLIPRSSALKDNCPQLAAEMESFSVLLGIIQQNREVLCEKFDEFMKPFRCDMEDDLSIISALKDMYHVDISALTFGFNSNLKKQLFEAYVDVCANIEPVKKKELVLFWEEMNSVPALSSVGSALALSKIYSEITLKLSVLLKKIEFIEDCAAYGSVEMVQKKEYRESVVKQLDQVAQSRLQNILPNNEFKESIIEYVKHKISRRLYSKNENLSFLVNNLNDHGIHIWAQPHSEQLKGQERGILICQILDNFVQIEDISQTNYIDLYNVYIDCVALQNLIEQEEEPVIAEIKQQLLNKETNTTLEHITSGYRVQSYIETAQVDLIQEKAIKMQEDVIKALDYIFRKLGIDSSGIKSLREYYQGDSKLNNFFLKRHLKKIQKKLRS